jgi:RHS repeat-associated protein
MAQFQYDGLDVVKEAGGAGDASYLRTLAIDEALTRTDTIDTLHFLADALGSTVALSDGTEVVSTNYTYAPFGDTLVTGLPPANPFQFTGRQVDGTGLYFYRARYFHPHLHRFVSEDPIGLASGDLNLYAYVGNNPLRFSDPYGYGLWDTVLEKVLRWAVTRAAVWPYARSVVHDNLKEGAQVEREYELRELEWNFSKCLENADRQPPSASKSADGQEKEHLSWEECINWFNTEYRETFRRYPYPPGRNYPKNYFWSSSR